MKANRVRVRLEVPRLAGQYRARSLGTTVEGIL